MADDWETMAVRLTADVSQYRQALNQAAKATSTFAADAGKATKATTAAYDKLGGSTSATAPPTTPPAWRPCWNSPRR